MKYVSNHDGTRSHVSAGYGIDGLKMPSKRDFSLPVCIRVAAACIAHLIWLTVTPAGNDWACMVVEWLMGV